MQEEAEKIELELPEGEVDIREADVDTSISEVNTTEETQVEEVKTSSEDELDKISESVQKRIDKLTYKMREAERQRDEAVNYAQNIYTDNSQLKEKLKNSDSSLFKEYDNRVQSDLERAKSVLKEAQEQGDADAIASATEQISRSAAEAENLRRLSAQQQAKQVSNEQEVVENVPNFNQQTNSNPQPDPKAEAWAEKNEWFGNDQAMTYAAFGIHRQLIDEGVDPNTENYYNQVDEKIKEYFPQKFSNEQSAPVQQVAASSRGATGKKNVRKI